MMRAIEASRSEDCMQESAWRLVEETEDIDSLDGFTVLVSDGENLELAVWDSESEQWLDTRYFERVVMSCVWWLPIVLPPTTPLAGGNG